MKHDHAMSLLQRQESRKQITANTIRILMLEEQNDELRRASVTELGNLKETFPVEYDNMVHNSLNLSIVSFKQYPSFLSIVD